MTAALVSDARAALTAALPGYHDASGDPHPQDSARLPLFHVSLTLSGSERISMRGGFFWDGSLSVILRRRPSNPDLAEEEGHAMAQQAKLALLSLPAGQSPGLWDMEPGAAEVEQDGAESRVTSAELTMAVRLSD